MKKTMNYLSSLIKSNTGNSSKSFSLVLSAIIGALIGICICFVLVYDVIINGKIDTDLGDLGIFLMSAGVYMVGGGFSKALTEKRNNKYIEEENNDYSCENGNENEEEQKEP